MAPEVKQIAFAKPTRTTPEDGFSQCLTHGKRRSLDNLIEDASGGYVCKLESECQTSVHDSGPHERGQCSVHGKIRSVDLLVDDGAGGQCCSPGNTCKETGEAPAEKWSTWGQGQVSRRRPTGPNLARKLIMEEPVIGKALEWKGKYGWVRPDIELSHPLLDKHGGKIYVSCQDLMGVTELTAGATVQFYIYEDASGLGAEECTA
mmetsp:Transcript_62466/g.177410  ORF Transcript_62466/g.177410 Transcript_62466/m.177410 type:complete len:205 (+) Transcript_62466:68-682(+)